MTFVLSSGSERGTQSQGHRADCPSADGMAVNARHGRELTHCAGTKDLCCSKHFITRDGSNCMANPLRLAQL